MSSRATLVPVFVLVLAFSERASALTSYVHVTVKALQNNGGYCPTTRNCTGSYYKQAQFGVNRPLRDLRIYLKSGNTTIGQGVTNVGGQTLIAFFWPPPDPLNISILIKFEEGNGRWAVRNLSGGVVTRQPAVGMLPYTPDSWAPAMRTVTLGTAAVPDEHANLFDVVTKAWSNGLSEDATLQSLFTGVSIRGFTSYTGGDCPTSCAMPESKIIKISEIHRYSMIPMHEMGHIANYLSHRGGAFSYGGCYTYPSECSGFPGSASGVWYPDSPEWGSASFEEGLATFAAVAGYYARSAPVPYFCDYASAPCQAGTFDVEISPTCGSGSAGMPINVTRYFWDLYDTVNDSETIEREMHRVLGVLYSFPDGTANGAEDEPRVPLDPDEDGRSLFDYRKYDDVPPAVWSANCSPSPGD